MIYFKPVGVGISFLVKALGNESNASLIQIERKGIEYITELFSLAKTETPSIVFFDSIDELLSKNNEQKILYEVQSTV